MKVPKNVPPIPPDAKRYDGDDGASVYDAGLFRWRFDSKGRFERFIEYLPDVDVRPDTLPWKRVITG